MNIVNSFPLGSAVRFLVLPDFVSSDYFIPSRSLPLSSAVTTFIDPILLPCTRIDTTGSNYGPFITDTENLKFHLYLGFDFNLDIV